ncbi:MAG: hypothetical protein MMC33_010045 [Icmadophila ericetorum]|nr:hypothetical protein [Icmadophila ericetorum]
MATSKEAPQQYKQPSRKGKKAWRKNVDVTEIQEGLEAVREEIIKGGVIAEKPPEELFILDTTGDAAIQKAYNKVQKPLKADEILARRSAVPAVDSRKRSLGVTDGVLGDRSKRRKGNGVSYKDYDRLKKRAYGGVQPSEDILERDRAPTHDPWEDVSQEDDPKFSYLEKRKPIKAPPTIKEAPISLLADAKQIPAVLKPKPGISYNPVFAEWNALLETEGQKELEAEKKRVAQAAEEARTQALIEAAKNEPEIYPTDDESAWEGFESGYSDAEYLNKKRPERKTPAERNKIKRRKEAERLAKHEAEMKKREKQAHHIRCIAKEISARNKQKSKALTLQPEPTFDSDSSQIDDTKLRRRKIGGHALPPAPSLELVLPDELQESLRLLKPEGNALKERFRSILVRGKVETRKPVQQARKKRISRVEKWTYKDFTVGA